MFLTAYNLAHYLTGKGLITMKSVVDGDFILAEAGRRNRNFKVNRRKHPGIFVKQVKSTEQQAILTIQREAGFYRSIHTGRQYSGITGMIPKFLDYEPSRYALALALTENAESLSERQLREMILSESIAAKLGGALGQIHGYGKVVASDPTLRPMLPCQIPWPLTLDQSGYGFLQAYGTLGAQLSQAIVEAPSLQPMLAGMRMLWQYDSLTHGDMKWDNCLLRDEDLVIVDWELADLGDGAWDVATIFKEYVVSTLTNRVMREAAKAQNLPAPAEVTVDAIRPSARAFWRAYAAARGLAGADARAYLDRAIRYTAPRMVIAVLEYCAMTQQLDAMGRQMLDTARRILAHPQIASAQLIGVPAN
jgi:tRNA A-37 threonylcarbamoyl transferase component Bud32